MSTVDPISRIAVVCLVSADEGCCILIIILTRVLGIFSADRLTKESLLLGFLVPSSRNPLISFFD